MKIYHSVFICKRKRCDTIAEKSSFLDHTVSNILNLDETCGEKMSLSSLFRFKRTNESLEVKNISIDVS